MVRAYLLPVFLGLVGGCSQHPLSESDDEKMNPSSQTAAAAVDFPVKLTTRHLPNAVQVHQRVISGGLPQGDAAFKELADLGIRTVISVDGAKPDVQAAAKRGLRYVHLPHGYNGIPDQRIKELAKAVRDLEGSVYIHCHHGKHRSPAAASVACVSAGLVPASAAVSILEIAGTSPNYRGLFQSAADASALEPDVLDALAVDFRAVADIPPLAEAMVALERTHDHLKLLAQAGWSRLEKHPDLDAGHEALLLREHFTELLRTEEVQRQESEYQELLRDSEAAARELEAALKQWQATTPRSEAPQSITAAAKRIAENCQTCHVKYRDVPLGCRSLRNPRPLLLSGPEPSKNHRISGPAAAFATSPQQHGRLFLYSRKNSLSGR